MRNVFAGINARPSVVVDYAPDPNGLGLFGRLSAVLQQGISGHTGTVYVGDKGNPQTTFGGDLARNPQILVGAAGLALYGAAHPVHPRSGDIGETVSTDALNNSVLRVFAARARRQGQGLT